MPKVAIENMGRLKGKIALRLKDARAVSDLSLRVGYAAPYCVHVHERLDIPHKKPTQAKFLEQPARQFRTQMGGIIVFAVKRKVPMEQAFVQAGTFLLKKSYPLVPVLTGFLRSSGFVQVLRKNRVIAGYTNVPKAVPGKPKVKT